MPKSRKAPTKAISFDDFDMAVADATTKLPTEHKLRPFTELGNAERLADNFGSDITYCVEEEKWFCFNQKFWEDDTRNHIFSLAIDTIKRIPIIDSMMLIPNKNITDELEKIKDVENKKNELMKWAFASQSKKVVNSMVYLAQCMPSVVMSKKEFDCDPELFNVQNGTVNLRTGKLVEHDRSNKITKCSPASFNEEAECPQWLKFINEITIGQTDLKAYLQAAVGYSLTGSVSEQCLFYLAGGGRNGKTTFIKVLQYLMANYAKKAPHTLITAKGDKESIPDDIALLAGQRCIFCSELEEGKRLGTRQVSEITGEETLTGRFLYKNLFQFEPTHKLWVYGNHDPRVTETTEAIWRRIKKIPFLLDLPDSKKDTGLYSKLIKEIDGIFMWALEGAMYYYSRGRLQDPDCVTEATKEYRVSSDTLGQFLDEKAELNKEFLVTVDELYTAYSQWCLDSGIRFVASKNDFGAKMRARGLGGEQRTHLGHNGRYYIGVGLKQKERELNYENR